MSGLIPSSHQFLILSHCDHGKVDYQKVIKVKSINKIDWETPLCLFKPVLGDVLDDDPQDTVKSIDTSKRSLNRQDSHNLFGRKGGRFQISKTNKRNQVFADKVSSLKKYVKHKIQNYVENKVSLKSPIIYNGQKTNDHLDDITESSIQASMEWESRNLVCYKLARRKKYAKRDFSFYIPETFVGGLFQCLVSPETKKATFNHFSIKKSLDNLKFTCDETLAHPVAPLIADYSGSQWWDIKKNIFNPGVVQTIPFLTTATPLNLRFSLSETPDMSKDTWASKINVNENYNYKQVDLHCISKAIASISDFLFKLIDPIDFGSLIRASDISSYRINGKSILENDLIISTIKKLSLDQKLGILLGMDKQYFKKLLRVEEIWDLLVGLVDPSPDIK